MQAPEWLAIRRGNAPLLLSMPHSGVDLRELESLFVTPWLARRDAGWWLELACRGYVREPTGTVSPDNWPPRFDHVFAKPLRTVLETVLGRCIEFALKPTAG